MRKLIWAFVPFLLFACGGGKSQKSAETAETSVVVPTFDADSAYAYVAQQVAFGPRVPQTSAHAACADYLLAQLAQKCDTAQLQQGLVELYDGRTIPCKNLIGSFSIEKRARVLLCAHWDSRPFSDQETDSKHQLLPVLGADDGASGVGVLLEIARQLQAQKPNIGVDIVLFDVEDYGVPEFYKGQQKENSWCLGSQFWSMNPHKMNYQARYGILLDMVGGTGATFYREQISTYFAPKIVEKVWHEAQKSGFSSYFLNEEGGAITDDHLYVNRLAGIPCIDIIRHDPTSETGFADYWHTQNDDMRNISKETLRVVGQTVLQVIYNEK